MRGLSVLWADAAWPADGGDGAVFNTRRLVRSFRGLRMGGINEQNDPQELLTLLAEALEEALEGTEHAALLRIAFGGCAVRTISYTDGGKPRRFEKEHDRKAERADKKVDKQ